MRKFSLSDINSQHQMKSSVQRDLRNKVLQTYNGVEAILDEIIPKKSIVFIAKCHNHVQIVVLDGKPIFFQVRDGPWIPTLRIIHKYPNILHTMQVDYGAIKHVLRGSNIMCPGLTSAGGSITPDIPKGGVVQINAEGKQSACGVGIMTMDSNDIRQVNKGICIEVLHTIGDGLWQHPEI